MIPELSILIPFACVVIVGVYFNTVTGFGLAMIIMALANGMGLASVADLATIICLVQLVNSAVALKGNMYHLDWRIARVVILGVLPSSILGVLLLDYLSAAAADVVQMLLGVVVIYGGMNFAWRPTPLKQLSRPASFFSFGILGGVIGGMFGIPGPPLIFQFYRQPMSLPQIRSYLILLFAVMSGTRTLFVGWQGQLSSGVLIMSALFIPVAAIATMAGRRYPPPFSQETMRRIAFVMLVLMGIGLIIPAALNIVR
jgi:uncharacterized membrane protein YfcA